VAREREIETGTDGPTVANAVSHALEELRNIERSSRRHGGWNLAITLGDREIGQRFAAL